MSFCREQKNTILSEQIRSKCCLKAFFEGVMASCAEIVDDSIHLTVSKDLAPYLQTYCLQLYSSNLSAVERKSGGRQIVLAFSSSSARRFLEQMNTAERILPSIKCSTCNSCFLKGIFLACGALSDPALEYRMEFKPTVDERRTALLFDYFCENGIELRRSNRQGRMFLYTKRSSVLEDFFALANMNQVAFTLMNHKIEHELRNNANRISNCEMSNIEKAVTASSRHLSAIEALDNAGLLSSLPEELEATARLRLLYPDLTISQLANLMTPAITKSGLTHRLNKILKICEELLGSM